MRVLTVDYKICRARGGIYFPIANISAAKTFHKRRRQNNEQLLVPNCYTPASMLRKISLGKLVNECLAGQC